MSFGHAGYPPGNIPWREARQAMGQHLGRLLPEGVRQQVLQRHLSIPGLVIVTAEHRRGGQQRGDQPTLQSLEAGLIALAHGLGDEHAMRVRRAMNCVLQQSPALTPTVLPIEAEHIGLSFDCGLIKQADA